MHVILRPHSSLGFLALAWLFLLSSGKAAADPDEAEQIVRSRVPREIGRFAERLQSNITIENRAEVLYQSGAEKSWYRTTEVAKKQDEFYVLMAEQKAGNMKATELCYGINSKYCFELKKNKSGNSWVVSNFTFLTPGFDERRQGHSLGVEGGGFRRLVDNVISQLTTVRLVHRGAVDGGLRAEKWLELPGFRLASVSLTGPNQNVLRANFTYDETDPELKKPCRPDSVMEFDLSMHCLPTRLHQSYKLGPREVVYDWQRQWESAGHGKYTVKRSIETQIITGGQLQSFRSSDDMDVSLHDLPETDFALPAFGLPEPPGVNWSRPFPYYLVAGGVGAACLGAFVFFRSRARRLSGGV
jgi:hypothetical protein